MDVRDATFEVMRRVGMTKIFGNPGSTEIPFLTDLPEDLEFVLALHEGSVVGMATGYAIATGRPAFVNLHTARGLGNAINSLANARTSRVPLVVVVGQQARRHLADEPFLTGRELERVAGVYPVASALPVPLAAVAPHTVVRTRDTGSADVGELAELLGASWRGTSRSEEGVRKPAAAAPVSS
jgi:benzoylformate decarboxylase